MEPRAILHKRYACGVTEYCVQWKRRRAACTWIHAATARRLWNQHVVAYEALARARRAAARTPPGLARPGNTPSRHRRVATGAVPMAAARAIPCAAAPVAASAVAAAAAAVPAVGVVEHVLAHRADPHAVLGVSHGAPTSAMRTAYRRRCLAVHPDKCSHPLAACALEAVQAAYQTLCDADRREVGLDLDSSYVGAEAFGAAAQECRVM